MVFFMKSGDYEQLLGAQLRNLGLKVGSSLKLYSPSIVPLAPAAANAAPEGLPKALRDDGSEHVVD